MRSASLKQFSTLYYEFTHVQVVGVDVERLGGVDRPRLDIGLRHALVEAVARDDSKMSETVPV